MLSRSDHRSLGFDEVTMYRVVPQASAEPRADERWPAGEGATKKIVKTVRFDAPTLQAALDGRSRWPMS